MNITFFIQNMSRSAGSERATSIIANLLARMGHQISILSICGDNTSFYSLEDGIELYTLFRKPSVNNRQEFASVLAALANHYKQRQTDLVIDIFPSLSLYSIALRRKFKYKVITWDHISFECKYGLLSTGRRVASKWSDYIVVLTEADKISYQKQLNTSSDKIRVIYNVSPFEGYGTSEFSTREKLIIAVGRLTKQKRFDDAIDIWNRARLYDEGWRLEIYGDGEEEGNLNKHIQQAKVKGVTINGAIKQIEKIYNKAKLMISTSEFEGLPMVMIEALSFGIPIVTLDYRNGPRDIVENGVNGLIALGDTRENQINLMVKQLSALSRNAEMLNFFSKGAYSAANRFSADSIGMSWNQLICTLERNKR